MGEQINQRKRIGYFDIFRGIGILFMLMGHVGFGELFSQYIHTFHMPMFFFVSGYFFRPDKFSSAWLYILHEAKALLIPYVSFALLCQPLHYIYTKEFSIEYTIRSLLSSNHNRIDVEGALWFLLCLFTAKIIFYFISYIKNRKIQALIIIALTICGQSIPGLELPLCLDSACACLGFIYLGSLLKQYENAPLMKKYFLNLPVSGMALLLFIQLFATFLNEPVNIRTNYYFIFPLFWISSVSAILFLINLSMRLERIKTKIGKGIVNLFQYLGKNSIVYLCLNEIVIGIFVLLYNLIFRFDIFFLIKSGVILILTIGLLAVASEVMNRTKLKVFLGKF